MSSGARKGRKHLCADALFRLLRENFATIAAERLDEVEIPLSDALMAACAMVSLKAPSLLAFDKQRAEGNLKTIYGLALMSGHLC
jgi:N-dimethylarginine dimethylaminohydrolase